MKKFTLASLLFVLFAMNSQAQQLANTIWEVYSFVGQTDPVYFSFTDTQVHAGETPDDMFHISNYGEEGDNFWIHDVSFDGGCNPADTGFYTFEIVDDSLHFYLIYDSCEVRSWTLEDEFFVASPLGIEDEEYFAEVLVYPNPVRGSLFIDLGDQFDVDIELLDPSGRLVFSDSIQQGRYSLNTEQFSEGSYYLQLRKDQEVEVRKVMLLNH